jgi:hypothetical protein
MSFVRFVTPSDVRDFKRQLDPTFRAVDVDVEKCAALPGTTKKAWSDFYVSWRQFFAEDESWLHTAAQMDRAESFERQLADWQRRVDASHCVMSAPVVTPEAPSPPANLFDSVGTALKWAAIAGGIVAAVWVVRGLRG